MIITLIELKFKSFIQFIQKNFKLVELARNLSFF